jgi:hypothetical protein
MPRYKLCKPRRGAKRYTADFMLTCYCEALGCSKASVTYDCVIEVIKRTLAQNEGIRQKYEEARVRLLADAAKPRLRVVK